MSSIELIYNFNSYEPFYYIKGYNFRTKFIKNPRTDFHDKKIPFETLSDYYLDKKRFETDLKNALRFYSFQNNEDLERYIFQYHIPKNFPNVFDNYYENKYAMTRSELLDLVKVRSEKEISDDNKFELDFLNKMNDPILQFISRKKTCFTKVKNINNTDPFHWSITSAIGNTILGGMLSRLVYEYIECYSRRIDENGLSVYDLDNIKDKIIDFKEFLLEFPFEMSETVASLWKRYM